MGAVMQSVVSVDICNLFENQRANRFLLFYRQRGSFLIAFSSNAVMIPRYTKTTRTQDEVVTALNAATGFEKRPLIRFPSRPGVPAVR